MKHVITMFDDIQRHKPGCMCGDCEITTGRSFGVSIRECKEYSGIATDKEDSMEKAILDDSVIERIYAYSPDEARKKAQARANELGHKFLTDI